MSAPEESASTPDAASRAETRELLDRVVTRASGEAARILGSHSEERIAAVLALMNPAQAQRVLERFPSEQRQKVMAAASPRRRQQWVRNEAYREDTVGHMMEPALAVFRPETTVAEATRELRHFVRRAFITYVFVINEHERLVGVVAMREMLLAGDEERLDEIMIYNPFRLHPRMELVEAMRATMVRHYPVYPVCEEDGRLIGLMRGQMLFEARTVELSLQPGSMVGIEKEERLATAWSRSFWFRHPWLQGNLFAGFVAAAVVGYFQDTIDRLVALAVFLPVVIGQSSNTGVQTLAVALRGMTLGELRAGKEYLMIIKETCLGLLNGALTGLSAAVAMYIFARMQGSSDALRLSAVVFFAMTASCLFAGVLGAAVPLILRRIGTDPAAASSIVLTTISDITSLAVFLGLATWLI
ncbi:MAG: magnesium transporter [Chthoniobacterales bacterium]